MLTKFQTYIFSYLVLVRTRVLRGMMLGVCSLTCLLTCLPINGTFAAEPANTLLPADNNPAVVADDSATKRTLYQRALDAITANDLPEYQNLHAQLAGYALLPYLEYAELSPRLASLSKAGSNYAEVDKFLEQNRGTYIGNKFEREWLALLANEKRWSDVIRYYNPGNTTAELTCQALTARLETGDVTFHDDVGKLWNVATSQPNACDPVFDAWIASGHLTADIAWQRFSKTLKARQLTLARFIAKQMPAREQALAQLYLQVDDKPQLLNDQIMFSEQSAEMRELVLHGLQRLAQVDATITMQLWHGYNTLHTYSDDEQLAIQRYITQRLLSQDHIAEAEALLIENPQLISEALAEWILRDALKTQDWPRLEKWFVLLPQTAQLTERWQYWHARALAQKGTPADDAAAQTIYQTLAQNRSFYGFIAADLLGRDYALVDKPVAVDDVTMTALYDFPAIARAHELYFVGDEFNARREWDYATAALAPEQLPAAGKLAESWGWYLNGIQAMIKASYWDDLQLRFPLAYGDLIANAASKHAISPLFLYAIARQESAFIYDAQSAVGAMGLMQLMPATGEEMAIGEGMNFSRQELLRPETNIILGSRYLAQMLQQFNGNRILTAAAYNAGPNRVKQWLNNGTTSALPYDIWIETIPFGETRGYVQNVLAFSVIYGYRTGTPTKFLTSNEAGTIGKDSL
ncbi:MAG: transglycosylase SLT domain-containing protein [Pseudomonadota bacterium]